MVNFGVCQAGNQIVKRGGYYLFIVAMTVSVAVAACQPASKTPQQQQRCARFLPNQFPIDNVKQGLLIEHCRYGVGEVVGMDSIAVEILFRSGRRNWFYWQGAPVKVLP